MVERKQRPDGDTQYIDEDDRQQIVSTMEAMVPRMSQAKLARACGVTASAINLLIKHPITREEGTRGCRFLAKLQKALGLVITTKTPAFVPNKEQHRRVLRVEAALANDDDFENWLRVGESLAAKR